MSLGAAIFGRYLRIVPQSWYQHICMRVELYGCQGGQLSSENNATFVSVMLLKLINFDIGESLCSSFLALLIVFQENTGKTWKEYCISVSQSQIGLLFS